MNFKANIARSEGDPKIIRSGRSSVGSMDRLARALGWFSVGLGIAEIVAPSRITRALGMDGQERFVQACGAREIASGMMTLSTDKHAGLCTRVAGDGLDLITLLAAYRDDNPKRENVAVALSMVFGVTLLDLIGAQGTKLAQEPDERRRLYTDRSGFPQGVAVARGAAREFTGAAHQGGH
jgi:hypothetical protein